MKHDDCVFSSWRSAIVGAARPAHAQAGKPVTIVDANLVKEADLAKLPHMNAALAKAVVAKRPFKTVKDLDTALSSLSKESAPSCTRSCSCRST